MDKKEIIDRINSVCNALNNITVTGVQNAGNLAGCFAILNEIVMALNNEAEKVEKKAK